MDEGGEIPGSRNGGAVGNSRLEMSEGIPRIVL